MVETKDGLANVDEIASMPGVDAIYIGPGDLALGLGMGWDRDSRSKSENEAHAAAVETIRQACERHGVTPGIHVGDAETSFRYAEQGFRLITVASDIGLIFGGSAATLARVREAKIPRRAAAARAGATTERRRGRAGRAKPIRRQGTEQAQPRPRPRPRAAYSARRPWSTVLPRSRRAHVRRHVGSTRSRPSQLADRLGYDAIFTADHLFATGGDPFQPFFEGWTTLAAWSQQTRTAHLGLLVGANTFRNPGVVAKMTTTLDHASGGRAILGLGAAWEVEEQRAHGIDPGAGLGQRLDWLDESLSCRAASSTARP